MQRKWMIGISIVALSYLLAGTLSAQTGQPSERGPRRPLGIYAKVSISDDIAALKNAGSPTTREALNDYFNNLYMEMLGNQAISGLTVVVHGTQSTPTLQAPNTTTIGNTETTLFTRSNCGTRTGVKMRRRRPSSSL